MVNANANMIVINKNPKLYRRYEWSRPVALVLGAIFNLVAWCVRIMCSLIHRRHTKLPPIEDDVITESVLVLADKIRNCKITSTELVSAYIKRIQSTDSILNYLVDNRFGEALIEAQKADELISRGNIEQLKHEKPLLGVPFTTKDSIAIKGLHQTAGMPSRRKYISSEDSEVVKRLRNAGAIPLGLTNVSELLLWWESFNQIYGRTDNPYDNTRIVGGSSGGEGCIQAIAGSAFGIGSDSGGSIRIPSHMNGVFGHKPTMLAVPLEGNFPSSQSDAENCFLGIGPMTRKAADLQPILKIISNGEMDLDKPVKLSDVKVYYQKESGNVTSVSRVDAAIIDAINQAIRHLETVCHVSPTQIKVEKFSRAMDVWATTVNVGATSTFTQDAVGSDSTLVVLGEMVKCLFGRSDHTFITLLNCFLLERRISRRGQKHDDMVRMRQELIDELTELLGDDGVLLYPTNATAAPYHDETSVLWSNMCYTAIVNVMGMPATHVPMGLNKEGLPVGFQVIAGWNNDRLCLAVAEEMDKAFGGWRDPSKAPKNC